MKTFKVMTLGASGAGKTVFLASMFKALSTQKNSGFKLDVEDSQKRKLLNSTYTQILTEDNWPPGTKDITEWTFTCQVQTTELLDEYNACQFTYFDYAGGRLTDIEEDLELEKVVQQADSILGLLDGHKIYTWLKGSDRVRTETFLGIDLPSILKRMQNLTIPVHFVITKWDLLAQDFTLSEIREKLLNIPVFEKLIRNRGDQGSIVRIVPVSAIGLEFAALQPDGSMKKNLGMAPIPFLVEAPMSCVLPDRLEQKLSERQCQAQQLERQIQKIEDGNVAINTFTGALDILGIGLDGLGVMLKFGEENDSDIVDFIEEILGIRKAKMTAKMTIRATSLLNRFLKKGVRVIDLKISNSSRNKKEDTLRLVKDEQSALMHAVNVFYSFERDLINRFPESRLV